MKIKAFNTCFIFYVSNYRLFPDTIEGGAGLESPYHVDMIIADCNDVYGLIGLSLNDSLIEVNENEEERLEKF